MGYKVEIFNNETGELRIWYSDLPWSARKEFNLKAACDCVLEGMFCRAEDETVPEAHCGYSKYWVPLVVLDDGTAIRIHDGLTNRSRTGHTDSMK